MFKTKEQENKFYTFCATPKSIPEIAFQMEWSYSSTNQKVNILVAGKKIKKIKVMKTFRYHTYIED